MTREEEIMKAARVYANGIAQHSLNKKYCEEDFIAGAQWADAHPHWISVEDELPPDNEAFIAYWNHFVIVQQGRDERFGSNKHITHWMPLPSGEHLRETTKMIEKGGEE